MCGIVGVVGLDASPERVEAIVSRMNARIVHRGPDGYGITVHADATLAMRRLAIVDTLGGNQPMLTEDGSIALVFNGEIYNAPALRRDLERSGVRFRSHSDTEVILRLYERDPDRIEQLLAGMWAFAVHDRRRRRVVLSRDRFGIKPLFIADTGTALAFASELRAFDRTLEPFAPLFSVDPDAAHAMLAWSYVPENATIYRGVRRLPPATRLSIDLASGKRTETTYYTLRPSSEAARARSLDEAMRGVEAVLRRAVTEHLESDVPVATFLSGGIDSTLVTAFANQAQAEKLAAYTIGFREGAFDESPFARQTASRLGVPINVSTLDEETCRAKLADAMLAYDEPFGDSSSLAVYLLSSHVSRDYKVALGGDGGDEAFAGYKKHRVVRAREWLASFPSVRDTVARAIGRLPAYHDRTRGWTELLRTLQRVARGLEGTDAHVYTQLTEVASLARTAPLVRGATDAARFERAAATRFESTSGDALRRTLASDLGSVLPNDMLVKVDRASMACHLEVRVPFLDHRVVEYGVGLPSEYTLGSALRGAGGKRVLRAIHTGLVGKDLTNRKKQGFGVPVEAWLRGPFARACERLFDRQRLDRYGILSSDALGDGRHREWLQTSPILVWHAFALAVWCEAVLGDGEDTVRELLAG